MAGDGIFRRGSVWYARCRIMGRDVRRAAGPTRQEALEVLAQMRQEAARLKHGLPVAPPKTAGKLFLEVVPDYLRWANVSKRSADRDERTLRVHLVPYFRDYRLADIALSEVEAYRAWRRTQPTRSGTPPTPATLNREVHLLTRILRFAHERGWVSEPPKRIRVLPEGPPRAPTLDLETEARLLGALPEWARLPVQFALGTGARASEICHARWRDVDLDAGTWTIPMSKNATPRQVPLASDLTEAIRPHRAAPEALLFTRNGHPITKDALSHAFTRAARAVGRGDLRLHDCRHVCASRLLAQGAALPEVASLLGHKSLIVSLRYTHVSPLRLRSLVSALPRPSAREGGEVLSFEKDRP